MQFAKANISCGHQNRKAWEAQILPFRPFYAAVAEYTRHPSSKRIHAGGNPAGSAKSLPGSVKVARRPVKPRSVGASPTLAAKLRKAGGYKLDAPVPKTGSARAEVGAIPGGRLQRPFRHLTIKKGEPMKIARRYQSQLLYRRSYKPDRVIRIRPTAKVNIVFRPVNRFGAKPKLIIVP